MTYRHKMAHLRLKLESAGIGISKHPVSRRLSTGMANRIMSPSFGKPNASLDDSDPNYAHLTVLDWMDKKFKLVKTLPLPLNSASRSDTCTTRRKFREIDPFLEKLKLEHRCNPNGRQVINLPKTPYGHHGTYNGDSDFMRHHIVDNKSTVDEDTAKEISDIARKFKLVDKRTKLKFSFIRRDKPIRFRELEDHYEVTTKTGRLICPMNRTLIESYENDKQKYQSVATPKVAMQTSRDETGGSNYKSFMSRTSSPKVSVREVVNRLYQVPRR